MRTLQDSLAVSRWLDFWISRLNPLWSLERPLARVIARKEIGPNAVSLVLRGNRHCGTILPGQHVNIGAEIDGRRIVRTYSPTLHSARRFSISVKAIEGGRLSRHLCEQVRAGDILDVGLAFGDMVMPPKPAASWLFLAAGSGITPLASQLRALAARGMPVELDLCYWARCEADLWYADEFRALARAHPSFRVHLFTTRVASQSGDVHEGRINAGTLQQVVGDMTGRQVHACGPGGFIAAARAALPDTVADIRTESFTLAPQETASKADLQGEVKVHLKRRNLTLSLPRAVTLLSALEAAGLRPASGCRMGICHTCSCAKSAGVTHDVLTGELGNEPTLALRLCVSRPTSDLILDL